MYTSHSILCIGISRQPCMLHTSRRVVHGKTLLSGWQSSVRSRWGRLGLILGLCRRYWLLIQALTDRMRLRFRALPEHLRHVGAWCPIHGDWRSICRYFNLIALWEERVESQDQAAISLEKVGDTTDDAGGINLLSLESLHNFEELVVDVRSVSELDFNLVEVQEGVLDSEFSHRHGKASGGGDRESTKDIKEMKSARFLAELLKGPCESLPRRSGEKGKGLATLERGTIKFNPLYGDEQVRETRNAEPARLLYCTLSHILKGSLVDVIDLFTHEFPG